MYTKTPSVKEFNQSRGSNKVVFTNGCFDILHVGHLRVLEEAKSLGDILVVGLNSDESVRRLKGELRPINPQSERREMLKALRVVDEVFIFEEDTPYELISQIVPDILVKGGDWSVDKIVGSDVVLANGGEVRSLTFVDGFSTTGTIERVLSTHIEE